MSSKLSKTVSADKCSLAFGMSWFTIQDGENINRTADQVIKKSIRPIDLYLLRKEEIKQYALACTVDGLNAKSYSAASILAEQYSPESWIYVLELDDYIWICAGTNGFILPDGDALYKNVTQAEAAFANLSPANCKHLALPQSWQAKGRKFNQDGLEVTILDHFFKKHTT